MGLFSGRKRGGPAPGANAQVRVLMVCMGNICRSPTAEGVFRHLLTGAGLAERIAVDSAGTHAYHEGEPPDPRARKAAARRGVDMERIRARRVAPEDFHRFHYLVAMDRANRAKLDEICPDEALRERILNFMDYAPQLPEQEVPDPYYGGAPGFERVLDLVEAAAEGLLEDLRRRHRL